MEAYLTPERESLLKLLEVAGIETRENLPVCAERNHQFAGFTYSYPIEVVICTESIQKHFAGYRSILEINRTVDHEALHAAQFCKHEGYPGSISDDMTTDAELEAQAFEGRPQAVADKVIKFCF